MTLRGSAFGLLSAVVVRSHAVPSLFALVGWSGLTLGCAGQAPAPATLQPYEAASAKPAAAPPTTELKLAAPTDDSKLVSRAAEPTTPFHVGRLEVRQLASTLFSAVGPAPGVQPAEYERFRLLATLQVGHSHLSMLDLSADETKLLAVSEAEAHVRVYDTESRRLVARVPVAGYDKFGVGEFLLWPLPETTLRVMFAGRENISLLDPFGPAAPVTLAPERGASLKIQAGLVGSRGWEGPAHASVLTIYQPRELPEQSPEFVPLLSLVASERIEDWVLSADRTRLGVVYFPSFEIEWIDLKARQVLWQASAPEFTSSLDLSPDGKQLALGGKELRVVSVADPERVGVFTRFDNNIHQVRFAPAGDAVAASSYDGHIRIVSALGDGSALTLRKVLRHTGTANVYAFRFTRDGRRLYSCSGDRTVRAFGL